MVGILAVSCSQKTTQGNESISLLRRGSWVRAPVATIDKDVEEALTGEDVTSQMKEKIKERLGYWSMMGAKVEEVAP